MQIQRKPKGKILQDWTKKEDSIENFGFAILQSFIKCECNWVQSSTKASAVIYSKTIRICASNFSLAFAMLTFGIGIIY
jgi:hypothetical protein